MQLLTTCLLGFGAWLGPSSQGGSAPRGPLPTRSWAAVEDVARILDPIAARDSCIESLLLPFETHSPAAKDCTRVLRGVWAAQGDRRAAYVLSGCTEGEAVLRHAVWDGARTREASRAAAWVGLVELVPHASAVFPSEHVSPLPFGDLLVDPSLPGELGLTRVNHLWSSYLEHFSDFRRLSPARVGEVECERILCDLDGGARAKPEPGYSFPHVLHVDVQSGLVRRTDAFMRPPAGIDASRVAAEWRLEQDGRAFVLAQRTEVTAVFEAAPHLWIGVEGFVRFRPWAQDQRIEVRVDRERARINAALPAVWFEIAVAPPTTQDGVLARDR